MLSANRHVEIFACISRIVIFHHEFVENETVKTILLGSRFDCEGENNVVGKIQD